MSNYVARLGQVAPRMAEAVVESQQRAAKDLIPPRFILNATIDQMRRFVSTPPAQNPFVTSLDERAATIKELAPADRAAAVAQAERIVRESVYPEWQKAIAYLESLVPRSAERAGLWRLEGGAAAYTYFLKNFTTTDLSPDQIHETGLRKVAELERDMDAVLRKLGRSTGTVKERVAQLKKDLSYPLTEDGPEADHGRHRRDDPRSRAPVGASVRRAAERRRSSRSRIRDSARRTRPRRTRRRRWTDRDPRFSRCRCGPIR